jgi:Xaa-Pro aminopeptidase
VIRGRRNAWDETLPHSATLQAGYKKSAFCAGKWLSWGRRRSKSADGDPDASSSVLLEKDRNAMNTEISPPKLRPIPFDVALLDRLLEEAGIDALIATSKHNVQYLLGGYRFFFFDYMDAIGVSRYLPILIYRRGKPEHAAYIGHGLERFERELGKFWPPAVTTASFGSAGAMRLAVDHLRRLGAGIKTIGIEPSFLPADADALLRDSLEGIEIVDAQFALERLRARKTPAELAKLREASERVVASMLAVFARSGPGMTKHQVVEALRREEVSRGLTFEYCLIAAGRSLNRAPSDQVLQAGDVLCLDSGGNYQGYIGDLCRMGIIGEPDQEIQDLLAYIDEVQQRARRPIRAGVPGGEIYAAAEDATRNSRHLPYLEFLAHGMGLISHEAPRLTSQGPVAYDAFDADRPLETAMVISIETTMKHPERGFIKLEDTIAVTDGGFEVYGDLGRGWNRMASEPASSAAD